MLGKRVWVCNQVGEKEFKRHLESQQSKIWTSLSGFVVGAGHIAMGTAN